MCCLVEILVILLFFFFFFFKQKTAYEMRISDWSSDVCSSDLRSSTLSPMATPGRKSCAPPIGRKTPKGKFCMGKPLSWALADKIGRASCRERVCQYV